MSSDSHHQGRSDSIASQASLRNGTSNAKTQQSHSAAAIGSSNGNNNNQKEDQRHVHGIITPILTDALLEEHDKSITATSGHAVRIISIDEKGEAFKLDELALKSILEKIPDELKVSIVSVVGAFRTGKSFLLDLFLRYLKATNGRKDFLVEEEADQSWLTRNNIQEAAAVLEGNMNNSNVNTTQVKDTPRGFGWKSGKDRCTTGIWMWSEYFVREIPKDDEHREEGGEKIAILLLDTQGMFDSSTGQMLTASIFGLSTLISSYQIYNLDKRIQEDNLQHLALFSEYGRVVFTQERKDSLKQMDMPKIDESELLEEEETIERPSSAAGGPIKHRLSSYALQSSRPFQRLELLVRDWQNFEDEDAAMEQLRKGMRSYLDQVLNERSQKDLKQVREQIHDCFETVSCFLLPHPGFDITKKDYNGDLTKLRPSFQRLLAEYVQLVFAARLVPKKIHGRSVTSSELYQFVRAYATLFKEAKIFPEAKTLLAATSEANNRSAVDLGLRAYRSVMDIAVGPNKPYLDESKLKEQHKAAKHAAITKFSSVATLGARTDIMKFKHILESEIEEKYKEYLEANKLRDPFSFVGPFIIPLLIGVFAYVARIIIDNVCFGMSGYCTSSSKFLQMLYTTIFTFIFFHLAATGHGIRGRLQQIFSILVEANVETHQKPSKGSKEL